MISGVLNPDLNLQFMHLQFTIGRVGFIFKRIIFPLIIIMLPFGVHAQNDTIKYDVGMLGVASTGTYSPFWLQSKSYGKITSSPYSADLLVGI